MSKKKTNNKKSKSVTEKKGFSNSVAPTVSSSVDYSASREIFSGRCREELFADSFDQEELRTRNVVEFAKFSFELEEKREQSLINQSSQMLTAFSVASAALLMTAPIILEHTCVQKNKILLLVGGALTFLLASMILAMVSQWRFKYKTMMNGDEFLKKISANKSCHVYQMHYNYQWIDQLTEIQDSKKKNNDKRRLLISYSMGVFFFAILELLVGFITLYFTRL